MLDHRRKLIRAFGGKKQKQAVDSSIKNRMDVTNVSGGSDVTSALESKAEQEPSLESITEEANQSRNIPPFNLNATLLSEAFPLDGIIPDHIRQYLDTQEIQELCDDNGKLVKDMEGRTDWYPSFVLAHVQTLKNLQTDEMYNEHCLMLLYLSLLYRMLNFRQKLRKDRVAKELFCSNEVAAYLLSEFSKEYSTIDGYTDHQMTDRHRIKLMLHMMALNLHLGNFDIKSESMIEQIKADLKLDNGKMKDYFHELGCKIRLTGNEPRIKLKLPLTFPKTQVLKRSRQ
eukprot:TRINITY_DN5587_c0_g3_i1.p1 TRINITY_DN5587_c0_g3~~TRINITY_DN5587_c0_g3_i1.p1  ORF type:complete len:311 (-),score=102.28 TRINITY_DN5587_c0_g3_i1:58-915(-)